MYQLYFGYYSPIAETHGENTIKRVKKYFESFVYMIAQYGYFPRIHSLWSNAWHHCLMSKKNNWREGALFKEQLRTKNCYFEGRANRTRSSRNDGNKFA